MVDDDHDSTLCQVIGKCKPYSHYQNISGLHKSNEVAIVATEVYDKSKRKHTVQIIPLLTKAENLRDILANRQIITIMIVTASRCP